MAQQPDTLFLIGPNLQEVLPNKIYVTPTGGTQSTLADALAAGGTATSIAPTAFASFTGPINTSGVYQQNGVTVLNQLIGSTGGISGSLTIGTGAGAALPAGAIFSTFIGFRAGNVFTGATGEATFIGTYAGSKMVSGSFATALGENAMGSEVSAGSGTAIGNDSQRNYVSSSGGNTSLGKNAMYGGGGSTGVAIGFQAMQGNAGVTTISGSATNGDVITLTFTGSFTGSPHDLATTVTAGQTVTQIAAAIIVNFNADPILFNNLAIATSPQQQAGAISWRWPGTGTTGSATIVTSAVSGSATEFVTNTGGSTGNSNIAIGNGALDGSFSLTTGNSNIAGGTNTLTALSSGNLNIAFGSNTMIHTTSGSSNIAFGSGTLNGAAAGGTGNFNVAIGEGAGAAVTSAGNNILFGRNTGSKLTGGGSNILIGPQVCSTTGPTTGSSNIVIGIDNSSDINPGTTSNTVLIKGATGGTAVLSSTATNTATPITIMGGVLGVTPTQGVTAHSGGGQGSALLITSGITNVTTVAVAADSMKLPVSVAGMQIYLTNSAVLSLQLFGSGTDTINAVATAVGVPVAGGKTSYWHCPVAGQWFGGLLA